MEYVTTQSFNESLIVWRTFWIVFMSISMMWCISSIIIDLVKMYTFKDDKKEIFKGLFSILKTVVYIVPISIIYKKYDKKNLNKKSLRSPLL